MKIRPPLAEALDLEPHPEGGWFRQRTRSSEVDALVSCLVSPGSDFEDFELG